MNLIHIILIIIVLFILINFICCRINKYTKGSGKTSLENKLIDNTIMKIINVIINNINNDNLENIVENSIPVNSADEFERIELEAKLDVYKSAAKISKKFYNDFKYDYSEKHAIEYHAICNNFSYIVEAILLTFEMKSKEIEYCKLIQDGEIIIFKISIKCDEYQLAIVNKNHASMIITFDNRYKKLMKYLPEVLISSSNYTGVSNSFSNVNDRKYGWLIYKDYEPIDPEDLIYDSELFKKWVEFQINVFNEVTKNGLIYKNTLIPHIVYDNVNKRFVIDNFDFDFEEYFDEMKKKSLKISNPIKSTNGQLIYYNNSIRNIEGEIDIGLGIYNYCKQYYSSFIQDIPNLTSDINKALLIMKKLKNVYHTSDIINEFASRNTDIEYTSINDFTSINNDNEHIPNIINDFTSINNDNEHTSINDFTSINNDNEHIPNIINDFTSINNDNEHTSINDFTSINEYTTINTDNENTLDSINEYTTINTDNENTLDSINEYTTINTNNEHIPINISKKKITGIPIRKKNSFVEGNIEITPPRPDKPTRIPRMRPIRAFNEFRNKPIIDESEQQIEYLPSENLLEQRRLLKLPSERLLERQQTIPIYENDDDDENNIIVKRRKPSRIPLGTGKAHNVIRKSGPSRIPLGTGKAHNVIRKSGPSRIPIRIGYSNSSRIRF